MLFSCRSPGRVFSNRLYMLGYRTQNNYYDLTTKTWLPWPAMPVLTGVGPCAVTWRQSFIVMGGSDPRNSVQLFNMTTQAIKHFLIAKYNLG
jgi:hypothetical protein